MSRKKYIINSLEACEKHEFDRVVKSYLKEVHGFTRISITDGKDDIGIDIKVFDVGKEKIQYQLTTQKSETSNEKTQLKAKIIEDIGKAKKNNEEYEYSKSLFFFYSKKMTNKAIREFEKEALLQGIFLTLIDANRIADESEDFIDLQKVIVSTNNLESNFGNHTIFKDDEKNLLFDLIAFGKSSDFKLQIVESQILQILYRERLLSSDAIIKSCTEKFKNKENNNFYEKIMNRLKANQQVIGNKDGYKLSESEYNKIHNLREQFEIDEKFFLEGINNILAKYGLSEFIKEFIDHLKKMYIDNFSDDINSIINNFSSIDLSSLSKDFLLFINKKKGNNDDDDSRKIAKELLTFCRQDKFIQKFSASKVFTEKTNLSKVETYINTKKKIFIDTQVALYGLCYFYDPKSTYNNYYYRTIKNLIELSRKNDMKLFLPDRYLLEITSHFMEAYKLQPFTLLPGFEKLGKSRNIFYNYYLNLLENSIDLSFIEFLEKFDFKQTDYKDIIDRIISSHLSKISIIIEKTQEKKAYDIEHVRSQFEWENDKLNRFRPKFILDNDSIVFEFLSDPDVTIHPLQPIFLTWDKLFGLIQPEYFRTHPAAQRWLLQNPGKYIDQYSILQFNIDSDTLTNELISLISDDIVGSTYTFLDQMTIILNPNDEIGLEYTKKIAEIRDREIHGAFDYSYVSKEEGEGDLKIDDVFNNLTKYYTKKDAFTKFKEVFTKKEFLISVVEILEKTITEIYKTKKFDRESLYEKFDSLIKNL